MRAWLAATLLVSALSVWVALLRREVVRLRRRLEGASRELGYLQQAFARFAPRAVVERIASRDQAEEGAKREVTVLFADLVGFTTLSERLEPDVLVRLLNGYFERMSRVIADHSGHVAKFAGDGIMALFGALEPNPWQASDAVRAALAMRAALADYNRELGSRGLEPLRLGIGIHCGPAIAGVVGSTELREFTVIGCTVNLAARIERLTRTHAAAILVTDAVRAALDPRFVLTPYPAVSVPGVADPVSTFAVESFAPSPTAEPPGDNALAPRA
jgi:class 3 adenylate cyclase